ncbi:MAG: hypothetical protein R2827_08905 [Bdellovibrionales bacterium]
MIRDSDGNINNNPVSSQIELITPPVAPTVAVTDPISSSSTTTYQPNNSLSVTNDSDADEWCVIEQDGALSNPSTPAWNDVCFGAEPSSTAVACWVQRGRERYSFLLKTAFVT